MDVLVAILTCSLHNDDALVRAIADNVHGNAFAVTAPELDLDSGRPSGAAESRDSAVLRLKELLAHGDQPLLGLMQVPVAWADSFGREPEDLFDPCINIAIGTAMLSEFDYACSRARESATPAARRSCVLHRYADALRMPELVTVVTLGIRYQRPVASGPNEAPVFPDSSVRPGWGANCLFVQPLRPPDSAVIEKPGPGF